METNTNNNIPNENITILMVDDNELFREGVVSLLSRRPGITIVGQAQDGYQAVLMARQLRPRLILMDVEMPGCNGVQATQLIKAELPDINIIMLTVSEEDKSLFAAIKAGAKGYLIKDVRVDELLKDMLAVNRGEAVIAPSMAVKLLDEFNRVTENKSDNQLLSKREQEVLVLVATGVTNREIAEKLVVTESTIKVHLHNILEKLHLHNRQHVVAYAIEKGLIAKSNNHNQN
jgi:DNA-binding NarL/FixJ family response regulator